jgi:hypothetical protein
MGKLKRFGLQLQVKSDAKVKKLWAEVAARFI